MEAGKFRYYGVSVERVEEALKAIEYPNVQTVQIIFNCFRHRPAELFFAQAQQTQVGILARVPLASGLLTGKLSRDSQFAADDHRNFNRHGEAFDVGETFSGVDYDVALDAVEEIRRLLPRRRRHGRICAALDSDVRCRHLRDSRRQAAGAGGGELRRLGPAAARRGDDGRNSRHLRCEDSPAGAPALVGPNANPMSIKHALILGAKGTLGGQLMKLYPEAAGWDREDIDVLDFPALRTKVAALRPAPDAIINCVAFNDVDGAEDRPETAMALNADSPAGWRSSPRELGVPLVHYCTNYVFDGAKGEYVEADRRRRCPSTALQAARRATDRRIRRANATSSDRRDIRT